MVQVAKLPRLHTKLIECLTDIMEHGEEVMTKGGPVRVSPSAATLNVVRQLLKDNNIQGEPVEGSPLQALAHTKVKAALPFLEAEETPLETLMVPDRDAEEEEAEF
jgi:hypothetical protein